MPRINFQWGIFWHKEKTTHRNQTVRGVIQNSRIANGNEKFLPESWKEPIIRHSRTSNERLKMVPNKQLALKPQDVVVALKLCLITGGTFKYADLGRDLGISSSEAHASIKRCTLCHLIYKQADTFVPDKTSLKEFLTYGMRYTFPLIVGPITRGIETGVSAAPMKYHFDQGNAAPLVWPDPEGDVRGISITPLYPRITFACKNDLRLYEVLSTVEALRGGAAREREIARSLMNQLIV